MYDLTLTLSERLPFWPGEKGFSIHPIKTIEKDGANVSYVVSGLHVGTHIDVPAHFVHKGMDTASMPIHKFIGKAKVFTFENKVCLEEQDVCDLDIEKDDIVLLNMKWNHKLLMDDSFRTDYVYVSAAAAQSLVKKEVKAVGVNYFSIAPAITEDKITSHHVLLNNGVVIIEGLMMEGVPDGCYHFVGLPLKIEGGNGSPIRAVLFSL